MGGTRVYSRTASAAMYAKVAATKQRNAEREREARDFRETDPFEQAKTALRRAGYRVFAHDVVEPGSRLIVVGRHLLTRDGVISKAAMLASLSPPKEDL